MICITGDTHGDWKNRFKPECFPPGKTLSRNDYVIVCGDLVIGTTLTLKGITLIGLKVSHGLHYL